MQTDQKESFASQWPIKISGGTIPGNQKVMKLWLMSLLSCTSLSREAFYKQHVGDAEYFEVANSHPARSSFLVACNDRSVAPVVNINRSDQLPN